MNETTVTPDSNSTRGDNSPDVLDGVREIPELRGAFEMLYNVRLRLAAQTHTVKTAPCATNTESGSTNDNIGLQTNVYHHSTTTLRP